MTAVSLQPGTAKAEALPERRVSSEGYQSCITGLESAPLAIWVKRLLKPRLVVPPRSRVQAGPIASRGPLVKALQARAATFASLSVGAVPWRRPSPGVTAEAEP